MDLNGLFLFVLHVGIKKHGHTADFPYYFVLTKFNAKHLVCLFVHAIIACEEYFYNAIGIPPLMRFYGWGGGEKNFARVSIYINFGSRFYSFILGPYLQSWSLIRFVEMKKLKNENFIRWKSAGNFIGISSSLCNVSISVL